MHMYSRGVQLILAMMLTEIYLIILSMFINISVEQAPQVSKHITQDNFTLNSHQSDYSSLSPIPVWAGFEQLL